MSKTNPFNLVEDYFNAQPDKTKQTLLELRQCILKAAPNSTELFNYHIPAYALIVGGKREQQIMIAGNKNSVRFYPHPTTMKKFDAELSDYRKGKGSMQFPLDKPLPKDLIIKMIKYRMGLLSK